MFEMEESSVAIFEDNGKILLVEVFGEPSEFFFPYNFTSDWDFADNSATKILKSQTGLTAKRIVSKGRLFREKNEKGDVDIIHVFKVEEYSGKLLRKTDERRLVWVDKSKLSTLRLPENANEYIKMLDGDYIECLCSYSDGFVPHYKKISRIIDVGRGDLPECAIVIKSSFITVADMYGFTKENSPRFTAFATNENSLNWQMDNENREMYAYILNGEIVGYYSLLIKSKKECELNNLCVLPEYRHRKIGEELLLHSFQRARKIGCTVMSIGIIYENTVLRRWYTKYGFELTTTQKLDFFLYTCGYMRKDLTNEDAELFFD